MYLRNTEGIGIYPSIEPTPVILSMQYNIMYVILILLLVWNKFVIIIILNIATTATIHCYIDIYIGRVADKDVDRAGDESGRSFLDRLKIKAVTLSQKRD